MSTSFTFRLNGEEIAVAGEPANRTLLDWLRGRGLTGTKEGCAEGDCGACSVALVERDAHGRSTFRAINACIALLPMFAGRELWTVEGIGGAGAQPNVPGEPHPVQDALVRHYGSQCGFCTPGFAVSMFEAFYRDDVTTPAQVADQLQGNLCRCTGYRPIRDAMMEALAARPTKGEGRDRFHLRLATQTPVAPPLAYEASGETFLRPGTLPELLELRARRPEAVLVAGATEIGVELTKKARRHAVLISTEGVGELRSVRREGGELVIGGAATLTDVEESLGSDLPSLRKMIAVFASRQIRSRATVAGNLVTASPIGDLPPVLLALGATVELASARGRRALPLDDLFVAYRKTALAPDEVLAAVRVPLAAPPGLTRVEESYKVSKRRELDISIVAAGFVVDLDGDRVAKARLAFGGVAATPLRARQAEAALEGQPWTRATLERAKAALAAELRPISDARSGAAYRRGVAVSLLDKLFDRASSEAQDGELPFVVGAAREVPEASRALSHESGHLHTTGRALYVDDLAERRGPMLELWPVSAPHAHARVLRRDRAKALAMPGVVAVLFAEDVPGENDVGALRKDESLLARDEVLFHGHMVAVVVAESYAQARAAAAVVEVDYEELPALLSIDDAIRAGSFHTEPHTIARGDVEAALAAAPRRLEGSFAFGGQEHFYLETQAAFADVDEDGEVRVVSSTQHPSEIQAVVSHVLHVPRNRVVVESPRMGGGFGGKETQGNTWAALVALAAWHTRRPVRVQLDRDLDLALTGKRHPFQATFRVGFDDAGRLLALDADLVSNAGWSLDLSESICDRALFHLDNAYYLPSVRARGRVAKTHLVSNTAFRGFGGPQGMLVIEEILDRVARSVGLLPELVRERNLYRASGEAATTHYGQALEDDRIQTLWRELARTSDLVARRRALAEHNARSGNVKRGIAITPVKFGISFTATFLNQAGAYLLVYRDGTVQVNHAGTEMGQGLYTKIAGLVMRELGLPREAVRVMRTSTEKVPNTSPTAASAGTDLNGAAVRDACESLRARLVPIAARLASEAMGAPVAPASMIFEGGRVSPVQRPDAGVPFAKVVERAYLEQVPLAATGFYKTPSIGYDRKTGRGKPFHYFALGAAVAEVEVDGYSGMKRVLRVDILHDVGDSLNPGIDVGQIEGAFVQGVGWLTSEELLWDPKGRLLTHSSSTYQIPAVSDAPADLRVALLPRAHQPGVIHGSKAVGEPPLMLALSVREAIRDAIGAFGEPGGLVDLPSPATHEAIWHAVQGRLQSVPSGGARAAE